MLAFPHQFLSMVNVGYSCTVLSDWEEMESNWRQCPEWDSKTLEELKDEVENYRPLEETNIPMANILLIGKIGAGKSSFINTINSIFRGNITSPAITGISDHSLTNSLKIYQVRSQISRKPLNFHLYDTRGLEEDQGIDSQELCYILDGNLPDRYTFNPSCQARPDIPGFNKNPEMKEKIHVVAFVVDASTYNTLSDEIISKLKNLRTKMNQRDIPQVVLLTKIDKVSEVVENDLTKTFSNRVIQELVDDVAKLTGIPRSHVMPLKNYECEMDLNQNVSILSLLSLRQILRFADDYLVNNTESVGFYQVKSSD
ncbi:interferon-induced protein 44-like isoform X2 [Saccostrea echinata]|uniref:interferon-induced protein 44-like isoform X2 n=1 Tax=Saccostrea echinata TaxID=191078 RepID=UPI002A808F3B|nr:interferon-induced protein 44-like isoform X2 [Saccostrea echinata]